MTKTPYIGPFRATSCCPLKELNQDAKEAASQLGSYISESALAKHIGEFVDHVKKSRKYADDMEKLIRRERSMEECDTCTYFYVGGIIVIAGIVLSSYLIYRKYYNKNQQTTEATDSERKPLTSNIIELKTITIDKNKKPDVYDLT